MLTKIITTAIAVVVLAAPTSAFYESCFYSDKECTTKVECLTVEELTDAYKGDGDDDYNYWENTTSCEGFFDEYNEDMKERNLTYSLNTSEFETCQENVSPCSLMCKGFPAMPGFPSPPPPSESMIVACNAACDENCAGCSTEQAEWETMMKEAGVGEAYFEGNNFGPTEESCKRTNCPPTIPGTTTKFLASRNDCTGTGIPGSASGVTAGALFAALSAVAVFV